MGWVLGFGVGLAAGLLLSSLWNDLLESIIALPQAQNTVCNDRCGCSSCETLQSHLCFGITPTLQWLILLALGVLFSIFGLLFLVPLFFVAAEVGYAVPVCHDYRVLTHGLQEYDMSGGSREINSSFRMQLRRRGSFGKLDFLGLEDVYDRSLSIDSRGEIKRQWT